MISPLVVAGLMACTQPVNVLPTEPPSWIVSVDGAEKHIRPPLTIHVPGERKVLPAGDANWHTGAKLDQCRVRPPNYYHCCQGLLHAETVRVAAGPGADAEVYELGVDYVLDPVWASMARVDGGKIGEAQVVWVEYDMGFQRLDTIAQNPDGVTMVFEGQDVRSGPRPERTPDGWQALAYVWVQGAATAVEADDIFLVDDAAALEMDRAWRAAAPNQGAEFAKGTLAKLRAGEPVTIVCLGDSVTAGGDLASVEGQGYVGRLEAALERRFPQSRIDVINAGVGGTPSAHGIERLQKDVLDHHPDLVTVMFSLNDSGTPHETYLAQLVEITERCQAEGAEVIHITSNFMTETWFGRLDEANETVRQAAVDTNTGLADAYRRWETLEAQGISYETLLLNTINHPDDRGHAFFVEELMRFFASE